MPSTLLKIYVDAIISPLCPRCNGLSFTLYITINTKAVVYLPPLSDVVLFQYQLCNTLFFARLAILSKAVKSIL